MLKRLALTPLGMSLFVGMLGCGSSGPEVGYVTGKITYKNQPVPRATITFSPEKPNANGAFGISDESGVYVLGTFSRNDGALVGRHKVSIVARDEYKGPVPKGAGEAMLEELQTKGKPLIPEKYFMVDSSGLTAEVKPGSNTLDFTLPD